MENVTQTQATPPTQAQPMQAQPIAIPDERHASVHLVTGHILCNVRGCKRPAEYEIDTRTAKCLNMRLCAYCMGFVVRGVEHFRSLRAYDNGYDSHA